jgi:LAGLIDADG endonuclease
MDDATRAYIAGFLDGDGSIIFQLVRRHAYVYGYQIRASVCFYQHTRGRRGLEWLRDQLSCGYIRDRAGHTSDYTVVGGSDVRRVLELVRPYRRVQTRTGRARAGDAPPVWKTGSLQMDFSRLRNWWTRLQP